MLHIESVLDAAALERMRAALNAAEWIDGRATAGPQSARAKANRQLAETSPLAHTLGEEVLAAVRALLLFQAAAIPERLSPPLFSRYEAGETFGAHIDNAFRPLADGTRIRTDLSATLFLSDPETYDGGALVVEDAGGERRARPAAGALVLYPSTSVHRVEPVTRGVRLAAVFWVQSLVADEGRRSILFDLDLSLGRLRDRVGDDDPAIVTLTGCYHNLLRRWGAA